MNNEQLDELDGHLLRAINGVLPKSHRWVYLAKAASKLHDVRNPQMLAILRSALSLGVDEIAIDYLQSLLCEKVAIAFHSLGCENEAIRSCEMAEKFACSVKNPILRVHHRTQIGLIKIKMGKASDALDIAAQFLIDAKRPENRNLIGVLSISALQIYIRLGRLNQCDDLLRRMSDHEHQVLLPGVVTALAKDADLDPVMVQQSLNWLGENGANCFIVQVGLAISYAKSYRLDEANEVFISATKLYDGLEVNKFESARAIVEAGLAVANYGVVKRIVADLRHTHWKSFDPRSASIGALQKWTFLLCSGGLESEAVLMIDFVSDLTTRMACYEVLAKTLAAMRKGSTLMKIANFLDEPIRSRLIVLLIIETPAASRCELIPNLRAISFGNDHDQGLTWHQAFN